MYRLNCIALFVFLFINVSAYRLSFQPAAVQKRIVRKLCILLLGGNLLRYSLVYPLFYHIIKIPAEFSTIAYFLVPLILLGRCKAHYAWASYSGWMAGFFYYMAMILAGERIYGADAPLDTCISMLCHGTLYFCAFLTIRSKRYSRDESGLLLLGTGYVAMRAAVFRPLILGRERMLIYILLDAVPVRALYPGENHGVVFAVYYLSIILFLLLSIVWFYRRNAAQYRRASALCAVC